MNFAEFNLYLKRYDEYGGKPPLLLPGFLEILFGPEQRGWFLACHAAAHEAPRFEVYPRLAELLQTLDPRTARLARLHLELADLARRGGSDDVSRDKTIRDLAASYELSQGLVEDLWWELETPLDRIVRALGAPQGNLRPAHSSQAIGILFVEPPMGSHAAPVHSAWGIGSRECRTPPSGGERHGGDVEPRGVPATLVLELVEDGRGEIRPATSLAFLGRDRGFVETEALSWKLVRTGFGIANRWSVRWRILRRDDSPMVSFVEDGSLGGALTLGLRKLLAEAEDRDDPLREVPLLNTAISATVLSDGRFGPVKKDRTKLLAAARGCRLPKIGTVVFAAAQGASRLCLAEEDPGISPTRFREGDRELGVIEAESGAAAAALLTDWQTSAYPEIDCLLPVRNRDFVGRTGLFRTVEQFIETGTVPYLVVSGVMGSGKTAFVTELLHRERAKARQPIYHFVSQHRAEAGDPERLAACLEAQLRRAYALAPPPGASKMSFRQRLERTLLKVGERLELEQGRQALFIEAVDQASISFLGKMADWVKLPPRVVCVITTRAEVPLRIPEAEVQRLSLSEPGGANRDVADYLRRVSPRLGVPLPAELIDRITASGNQPIFFSVVECLRRLEDPTIPAEERQRLLRDPAPWLQPPEALMEEEIRTRQRIAEARGIAPEVFRDQLALLAVSREELTRHEWEGLGLLDEPAFRGSIELCVNMLTPRRPAFWLDEGPLRFTHPGFMRWILTTLTHGAWVRAQTRLASACAAVWNDRENRASAYARRHLLAHLRKARRWGEFSRWATDLEFIEASLAEPVRKAGGGSAQPARAVFDLVRDLDQALGDRGPELPGYAEVHLLHKTLRAYGFAFMEDPSLLVPELRNRMVWSLPEESRLRSQLEEAVSYCARPVLRRQTRPRREMHTAEVMNINLHGRVTALASSADGELLAAGDADGYVEIYGVRTGKPWARILREGNRVAGLAFHPKRALLFVASADGWVRRYRFSGGSPVLIGTLTTGENALLALAISRNGEWLATGGSDSVVRIWETETFREVCALSGHGAAIGALAFSPVDDRLASASEDTTARLWDVAKGAMLHGLRNHGTYVQAVTFSPDGTTVVTGCGLDAGEVRWWNADSSVCERLWRGGHSGGVCALCFSRDGHLLASGSHDGSVLVRYVQTGHEMPRPTGHGGRVTALSYLEDGMLISSGYDQFVRGWEVEERPADEGGRTKGTSPAGNDRYLYAVDISPDGQTAASSGAQETIRFWRVETGELRRKIVESLSAITCLAFSPEGQRLAFGSKNLVRVMSLSLTDRAITMTGQQGWIQALGFSRDGSMVAAGGDGGVAILWDTQTGNWLRSFAVDVRGGQTRTVSALEFSPVNDSLVTAGPDGSVVLWDVRSDSPRRRWSGHDGYVSALAFAPDGKRIASGGCDGMIRVWPTHSETRPLVLDGRGGEVTALAFSPDGRWLASGCDQHYLRVWDSETGRLMTWMPCDDTIVALRFDPDSRALRAADKGHATNIPTFYLAELRGF